MKRLLDDFRQHLNHPPIMRAFLDALWEEELPDDWPGRIRMIWRVDSQLYLHLDCDHEEGGYPAYHVLIRPKSRGRRWTLFSTLNGSIRRFMYFDQAIAHVGFYGRHHVPLPKGGVTRITGVEDG